ncbi:MAG: hypothetical protein BGP16_03590 [Sphingobium sp. 66-54]|nr:MAG: hypothetical protein BGP16_03590 [Sphingobium sp. 66-54]
MVGSGPTVAYWRFERAHPFHSKFRRSGSPASVSVPLDMTRSGLWAELRRERMPNMLMIFSAEYGA